MSSDCFNNSRLSQSIVEPDYVNQCFMAWLKDDCLTSESFLGAIHCCTSPAELDHLEDRLQKVNFILSDIQLKTRYVEALITCHNFSATIRCFSLIQFCKPCFLGYITVTSDGQWEYN